MGECGGCYAKRRYQRKTAFGNGWWGDISHLTYKKIINNLRNLGWHHAADALTIQTRNNGIKHNWSSLIPILEILESDGLKETDIQTIEYQQKGKRFLPDWDEPNYPYEILIKQNEKEE